MKSLLSISLLSVLLSVCNSSADKKAENIEEEAVVETARIDSTKLPAENEIISEDEPAVDGAVDEPENKPASTKPKVEGALPDTSVKKVIEHGAPDKAYNDSV
ncbi:MAG: hypothetical protein ACPG5W_02085, partial [Flavobacteriales bacterium]